MSNNWKQGKVLAFLTNNQSRTNIIANDTINAIGYVILKNIPKGIYNFYLNDKIMGKIPFQIVTLESCLLNFMIVLTQVLKFLTIK